MCASHTPATVPGEGYQEGEGSEGVRGASRGYEPDQVWHLHQQGVDSETPRGRTHQVRETSGRFCNQSLHARRELLKTPKVRAFDVHPVQAPLPP